MKFQPTRGIGGLTIRIFNDNEQPYGNGRIVVNIPRDALSLLAVEAIREIGMDASEDLILTCRQVVELVDKETADQGLPAWRTLRPAMQEELWEVEYEEIRDSAKEIAIEELDKRSLQVLAEDWILGHKEDDTEPTAEEMQAWIEQWQMVEPDEHEMYEVMESIRLGGITFSSLADSQTQSLIDIGDWLVAKDYVTASGTITPAGIEWMHGYEERAQEAME